MIILFFLLTSLGSKSASHFEHQFSSTDKEQLQIQKSLLDSLERKYTFWERLPQKKRTQIRSCFSKTKSPLSDIDLLAHVRSCLAMAGDSHLIANLSVKQSAYSLGLRIVRHEDGFIVDRHFSKGAASSLVGKKVSKIDGVSIEAHLKKLTPYIGGSSEAARLAQALISLTERDFLPPTKSSAVVEAEGKQYKLSWKIIAPVLRFDQKKFAESKKIQETKKSIKTLSPLFSEDNLMMFRSIKGRPALFMGQVQLSAGAACYLQIGTFDSHSWKTLGGKKVPFLLPIRGFLKGCGGKGYPLILDLRENNGGDPELTEDFLMSLAPKGKELKRMFTSARLTKSLVRGWQIWGTQQRPARDNDDISSSELYRAVQRAATQKLTYLPKVATRRFLRPIGKIEGFSGKIVTLIGPQCVSACDIVALTLRESGRATLVGQGTAGAFGGYDSVGPKITNWNDGVYDTLEVKMPNTFVGLLKESSGEGAAVEDSDIIEGQSVKPLAGNRVRIDDLKDSQDQLKALIIKNLF